MSLSHFNRYNHHNTHDKQSPKPFNENTNIYQSNTIVTKMDDKHGQFCIRCNQMLKNNQFTNLLMSSSNNIL